MLGSARSYTQPSLSRCPSRSFGMPTYLSIYLSVYLSIYLFIYLSIYCHAFFGDQCRMKSSQSSALGQFPTGLPTLGGYPPRAERSRGRKANYSPHPLLLFLHLRLPLFLLLLRRLLLPLFLLLLFLLRHLLLPLFLRLLRSPSQAPPPSR